MRRLVDADELKKVLAEYKSIRNFNMNYDGLLAELIDNAPTVEPCYQTTSCLDCKMYDKEKHNCPRFCEVIRNAIEERPHGEWLKSDMPESVLAKCSICGFDCGAKTHNFCPECGADMRGDKNETD